MAPQTVHQGLTNAEWEILRELLSRESRELKTEIHHTDARKYRHDLRSRLKLIEELLERISMED